MKNKRRKLLAERRGILKEMERLREISNSWGSSIDYARYAANERYRLGLELQRIEDKLYPEKAKRRKDEERKARIKAQWAPVASTANRITKENILAALTFDHAC